MKPWNLLVAAAVAVTALVNVVSTVRRVVPPPRSPEIAPKDNVLRNEARFAGVPRAMQRHGVRGTVGYLADLPASEMPRHHHAMEDYFLTQFALAPWVLDAAAADVAWTIANFRQPTAAPRIPAEFQMVEDFGHGVMLLRRRSSP